MRRIYLDNNATTPVHPDVIGAMLPFHREDFGNPSSLHWAGKAVKGALEMARRQVASLINCNPAEVVFTSGGSESLNTAIKGVAAARHNMGNHIITTRVEHSAVFNCCRYLEKEGYRVTYLEVDAHGMLDLRALEAAISDQTILIAAMYANNETGVIFPVREIGEIAAGKGVYFLCDAIQAVGKVPVDFRAMQANLLAVSGHKLHGPKGTGALIIKEGTQHRPLIHGGSQERNRRAGTENVAGIVGFGKACELAALSLPTEIVRIGKLRHRLQSGIMEGIAEVKLNGHPESRLPNTLNISFRNVHSETLLAEMDKKGIAVSAGSACSSGSREHSRVLTAMGIDGASIGSSVRFSLGRENSEDDVDYVLGLLPDIVVVLRREKSTASVMGQSESVKEYSSEKITRNGREPATDPVMVEETIELIINGTKLSSIVTTPDLHKELAVGYMVTEGAVRDRNDIEDVMEKDGRVFLQIRSFDHFDLWYELRSSGCIGVNWEKRDEDVILPLDQTFRIDVLLDSMKHLYDKTHDQTRGAHSASLVDADGNLKYKALDIGRHNAIDKVVGMAVLNGDDLSKLFLISSGRQPGGMVMKAVRAGIPLIVSKAAPVSSGIDSALRSNITLCCFADTEKIKVFSAPERIK